ncbi:MAG: MarR family transcriptional regulator [Parvibaculum sp.]|nr:MarR family transcriptional regulator [Parvibaculum sp.]
MKNNKAPAAKPETESDDPLSPEKFVRTITELGVMLATIYDRRTGLTRNQTRIVVELLERDGQTQTELANTLTMHKVSVGIYAAELEAMGLVERRTHPTDGRAKCIWVSPLLHANKHIGREHYAAIHRAATSGIADKDYLTMLKCMERMYENLTALDAEETGSA